MPSRSVQVAGRLDSHLKRFEGDPTINRFDRGISGYYIASARATRNGRISIIYVVYQGARTLSLAEAEAYLAWLDAGNVGTHHEMRVGISGR